MGKRNEKGDRGDSNSTVYTAVKNVLEQMAKHLVNRLKKYEGESRFLKKQNMFREEEKTVVNNIFRKENVDRNIIKPLGFMQET